MDVPLDSDLVVLRLRAATHDQGAQVRAPGADRDSDQDRQQQDRQQRQSRPASGKKMSSSHGACLRDEPSVVCEPASARVIGCGLQI